MKNIHSNLLKYLHFKRFIFEITILYKQANIEDEKLTLYRLHQLRNGYNRY